MTLIILDLIGFSGARFFHRLEYHKKCQMFWTYTLHDKINYKLL